MILSNNSYNPTEQHALKSVNYKLNTDIYSYFETSGGQSSNLYLNVVHFFSTSVNKTSVAARDSCFPAMVSNTCSSIKTFLLNNFWSKARKNTKRELKILKYL